MSGLFEPMATVAELRAFVLRSTRVVAPAYLRFCEELVGCWIRTSTPMYEDDSAAAGAERVAYVVR